MRRKIVIASIKSALLVVALMLMQHLDELWRGGLSLSPMYLLICGAVGLVFTALAYLFHTYRAATNSTYYPEWLYSPLILISVPLVLVGLTLWRG
jgi:uncharacterized membrane protein